MVGRAAGAERAVRRQIQVVFQAPLSSFAATDGGGHSGEGLEVHEPAIDAAQRRERILQALYDVV